MNYQLNQLPSVFQYFDFLWKHGKISEKFLLFRWEFVSYSVFVFVRVYEMKMNIKNPIFTPSIYHPLNQDLFSFSVWIKRSEDI